MAKDDGAKGILLSIFDAGHRHHGFDATRHGARSSARPLSSFLDIISEKRQESPFALQSVTRTTLVQNLVRILVWQWQQIQKFGQLQDIFLHGSLVTRARQREFRVSGAFPTLIQTPDPATIARVLSSEESLLLVETIVQECLRFFYLCAICSSIFGSSTQKQKTNEAHRR